MRPLTLLLTLAICICLACSKNGDSTTAADFYGTWIKGDKVGDTLGFMSKGGKNILRYNMTFNPSLNNYQEVEYAYRNNKLCVALYTSEPQEINSFTWKEANHSFQLEGYQLYSFMSSLTTFTFVKL